MRTMKSNAGRAINEPVGGGEVARFFAGTQVASLLEATRVNRLQGMDKAVVTRR